MACAAAPPRGVSCSACMRRTARCGARASRICARTRALTTMPRPMRSMRPTCWRRGVCARCPAWTR
eukprot:1742477-Prymnesium_polylepis.1